MLCEPCLLMTFGAEEDYIFGFVGFEVLGKVSTVEGRHHMEASVLLVGSTYHALVLSRDQMVALSINIGRRIFFGDVRLEIKLHHYWLLAGKGPQAPVKVPLDLLHVAVAQELPLC